MALRVLLEKDLGLWHTFIYSRAASTEIVSIEELISFKECVLVSRFFISENHISILQRITIKLFVVKGDSLIYQNEWVFDCLTSTRQQFLALSIVIQVYEWIESKETENRDTRAIIPRTYKIRAIPITKKS